MRSSHQSAHRRGLTLIELIVVLVILTALGAILVPIIGNAITRSHLATCLTNFPEVTKMLNQASNLQGGYGDGWTNPENVMTPAATDPQFSGAPLTDDQIGALAGLGLENFTAPNTATPEYNVTFNNGVAPGSGSALTGGTGGTDVAVLTAEGIEALNLPPLPTTNTDNEQYVFFAIDKSWSLLGTVTPEPPVHFGDTPGALPDEVYSRWGAIFKVSDGDATADNGNGTASFQRVTVYIGDAFETADNHSAVYWQEIDTQQ